VNPLIDTTEQEKKKRDKSALLLFLLEFEYDRASLRYKRLSTGRYVSPRAVKRAINRVIVNTQIEIRAVTEQLTKGQITIGEWQYRMSAELKNLHVSGAMAARGGPANMAGADYLRAARELKSQYRYLQRFADAIEAGQLDAKAIQNRAASYVRSQHKTYEGSRRDGAIATGFDEERNLLGPTERHCTTKLRIGCKELTAKGWQPLGAMPIPGDRQCLMGCACMLKFRRRPLPTF